MRPVKCAWLTLLAASLTSATPTATSNPLPLVDLGYEIHQAISFNVCGKLRPPEPTDKEQETGQTYNFSNIRFAQAPVGALRFKAPLSPTGRNTTVQTGAQGRICPQAFPLWEDIAEAVGVAFVEGNATAFNLSAAETQLAGALQGAPAQAPDPRETEDCLFLDVFVPKKVFDNRNNVSATKAAVLLTIHGGGFAYGSKGGIAQGNPSGLIAASQATGRDGIVLVQINYRLGALGWLAGSTLQAAGGVSNAGLYDQRLAIEWVAKNAHLFGGDGKNITLLGQSAGGGSIMHQITAFGGQQGACFQGAIPQSPQENTTQAFLDLLNVSTIAEARALSSEEVISTNFNQILYSPYNSYTYGPVVDGIFAPAEPGLLLSAGSFSKNIKIMAGHNTNEGVLFTNPTVRTDAQLEAYLMASYPGIATEVVTYITKKLYPAMYDGSMPYTNGLERTFLIVTESIFTCNTNYLARAFNNQTYNYQFEVFPALHGFDIDYTFYNGQPTNITTLPPLIAPLAEVLQGYITNFAMTGNPNGKGLPPFPIYGKSGIELGLNVTVNSHMKDPTENKRCLFWQKSLYN